MSHFWAGTRFLKGKRVVIRPPRPEELSYIQWLWADADTMRGVGGPITDFAGKRAEEWFTRWVDPGDSTRCYGVIEDELGSLIGEISFRNFRPVEGSAMFDIKVQANRRRGGYAKDAMETFLRFFYETCGGKILLDDIALDNLAGQQVLLSFGFEHDHGRDDVFLVKMTKEQFLHLYGDGETR